MLADLLRRCVNSGPPVSLQGGIGLPNQGADAGRTLTLTGISPGQMIVSMTANRINTAPVLLPGYTNILSSNGIRISDYRSLRLQYKISTNTSETISWTGAYGFIVALNNVTRVGKVNTINTANSGFTVNLPDLSGLNVSGKGLILAGCYASSNLSVTSPYTMQSGTVGYLANNTNSSITSAQITITSSLPLVHSTFACEFL